MGFFHDLDFENTRKSDGFIVLQSLAFVFKLDWGKKSGSSDFLKETQMNINKRFFFILQIVP